jgi:hypothetical protein
MRKRRQPLEVEGLETYAENKQVHWICPDVIKFIPREDFTIACLDEKIADGDWDKGLLTFEEGCLIYKAYRDVVFDKKKWQETELYTGSYQAGIKQFAAYEKMSEEEIKTWKLIRCKYNEYLYRTMQHFGYVQNPFADFVSVLIGRNGEVILNNGRHRASAAKLMSIPVMTVLIDVRHQDWVSLETDIAAYTMKHNGMVYAPLDHFSLNFKARQPDRKGYIHSNRIAENGSVLDLGCNWGSIARSFADEGFNCTLVESDDEEFSFLERLSKTYDYKMVKDDIYDFVMKDDQKYDIVLALSIFHHLAKTAEGHARLLKLLDKLECDEMFFQMPDEKEMELFRGCYKIYDDHEMLELLKKKVGFKNVKRIAPFETRRLYHLIK